MNITLPDSLRGFVAMQVASGKFANPDEYVAALIRNECMKGMESKIVAGWDQLERGEGIDMTDAEWRRLKEEYKNRNKMT